MEKRATAKMNAGRKSGAVSARIRHTQTKCAGRRRNEDKTLDVRVPKMKAAVVIFKQVVTMDTMTPEDQQVRTSCSGWKQM